MSTGPETLSVRLYLGRIVHVELLNPDGSHDISMHHLDPVLGCRDGRFSIADENFFRSARNVRLIDSTLHAELFNSRGEWVDDAIRLGVVVSDQPAGLVEVRVGGEDGDRPLAQRFGFPDLQHDWNLIVIGTSALLFCSSLADPTLPLVYHDLARDLGNDDGYFDRSGNDFLETARNVGLLGTRLYADLLAENGTWRSQSLDVKGFVEARVMLGDPSFGSLARFVAPELATVEQPRISPPTRSFYTPLQRGTDSIRLCLITPGQWGQSITCDLFTPDDPFSLSYHCLSYAWGDPTDTITVWVNGQPHQATRSLHMAMRQLRQRNEGVPIWIDALCINQLDNEEKSWQVSLMGDVYRKAGCVLIWLGEDPDKLDDAGEGTSHKGPDSHLLTLEDTISRMAESGHTLPGSTTSALDQVAAAFHHKQILESFLVLLRAPWWERMWVLQEVSIARHAIMLFGPSEIGVNKMAGAMRVHFSHSIYCQQCRQFIGQLPDSEQGILDDWALKVSSIAKIREHQIRMSEGLNGNQETSSTPSEDAVRESWSAIFESLSLSGARAATDSRDKVFGILAMIPSDTTSSFVPDYSLSVERVYQDFTCHVMASTRSLSILDLACWANQSEDGPQPVLPSWVVDWRLEAALDAGYTPVLCSQRFHFNAPPQPMMPPIVTSDNHLAIEGVRIDSILAATEDSWPGLVAMYKGGKIVLQQWLKFISAIRRDSYPSGGTIQDAFWRTLLYDHLFLSVKAKNQVRRAEDRDIQTCRSWEEAVLSYGPDDGALDHSSPNYETEQAGSTPALVDATIHMCALYKKLFRTTDGYLGLGPRRMRAGDELHVLKSGTQWLYVLRPAFTHPCHNEEHPVYKLVGPAYAHGWMDGEALGLLERPRTLYLE